MKTVKTYTKYFSNIGNGIQNEETINYNVCESKENNVLSYGLEVESFSVDNIKKDCIYDISIDRSLVDDLARYLYENSVCVDSCRYIIYDYV